MLSLGTISYPGTQSCWQVFGAAFKSTMTCSGGFRNLERVVQPQAREAQPKILGLPWPLSVT